MLINVLLILAGLVALFFGAEWLVTGAARIAASFGVPALVIGLTLVAFSTSAPELMVSVTAALDGASDLALGNVVGSNIANIGLILGLTGLLFPIAVHSQVIKRELPFMLGFSLLAVGLAWDGQVGVVDGAILVLCLFAYNGLAYRLASKGTARGDVAVAEAEEYEELEGILEGAVDRVRELGRVVVGIAILLLGSRFLVTGATALARGAGISDLVIGITLVAFGTSLPELATSLVSAYRKEPDISVGNIVGSNIFNLLSVLGITALVRPVPVAPDSLRWELPVMLGFSFVLWLLVLNRRLARWQGALLFLAYLLFTASLFGR